MRHLSTILFVSFFLFFSCSKDEEVPVEDKTPIEEETPEEEEETPEEEEEPNEEENPGEEVKSSEKQIITFKFPGLSPEIEAEINEEEKTISAEVPHDTDVTALEPEVIISDEATVSPTSGTATDFTNEVDFTVTAENGSTAVYKVTVTKLPPEMKIFPIGGSLTRQRGKMFVITGEHFTAGEMEVYLYNDDHEYKMNIVEQSETSLTVGIIHEMELGEYNVKVTDGETVLIAPEVLTIEVESPKVTSISKTEVLPGEGFTITGEFFAADESDNDVYLGNYKLNIISASTTSLEVEVPGSLDPGDYTLRVVSYGKSFYYNAEDVTVLPDPDSPFISSINALTFTRGETIIITGQNLKKPAVATNINFMPADESGPTIVRSASANAEGTEVTYVIPNDFTTDTYKIVIEVDFNYSNEYEESITINP